MMDKKKILERRLKNYRGVMAAKGLDALLFTNYWSESPQGGDFNITYLSLLMRRYIFGYLILTQDDCGVWVEADDTPRAREQSWLSMVQSMEPGAQWGYSGPEMARIALKQIRALTGRKNPRIGIDGRFMSSSIAMTLLQERCHIEDVLADLELSKVVKDDLELETMRRANAVADKGILKVMELARDGVSGIELAAQAEAEMRVNGAECFWWRMLIGSDPVATNWFDMPTARKVRKGELLMMDFTPVVDGYGGDIARTFVVGKPTAEQMDAWKVAKDALDAAVSILKEGVTLHELMDTGVRVAERSRFKDQYIGTGHGVGLYSHVYPIFLSGIERMKTIPKPQLDIVARANMTFAMEIIITVPGLGGVRLEDTHIVGKDSSEKLNHSPMVPAI